MPTTAAVRERQGHDLHPQVLGLIPFFARKCATDSWRVCYRRTRGASFATKEAVRQRYPRDTDRIRRTKTWRHHSSKTPRSSHAAMDGETVGLDDVFSNGADYPGDLALPAKEAVNCHCTMDVGVRKSACAVGKWPSLVLGSGSGGVPAGKPYKLDDAWFNPNDPEQVAMALDWCRNVIRHAPVENAMVMTPTGDIWRSVGTVDSVNLDGAPLDGAIVVHNHPEEAGGGSFGGDDYEFLREHPKVSELWAVTEDFDHRVRLLKELDKSYNEAYGYVEYEEGADYKHLVMEWLHEQGYVEYKRTLL